MIPRAPRQRELGISMVEVIVVLLIIGIVAGVGIASLKSSRGTGGRLEARAAAATYADAVERFQNDHGRLVPMPGASVPTVSTAVSSTSTSWVMGSPSQGPVKVTPVATGRPVVERYLRKQAPPIVTRTGPAGARIVLVRPGAACTNPGASGGTIVYLPGPRPATSCTPALSAYQYQIVAYWDGTLVCRAGDAVKVDSEMEC